ncbi:MAG TPA: hypothetical protein VF458_21895 [Ktedonobacteraceae bacterium]
MSSNGAGFTTPPPVAGQRRVQISRWLIRLLIAFVVCVLVVLFFFTSDVVSR